MSHTLGQAGKYVDRPPQVVYDFFTTPDNWPDIFVETTSVRAIRGDTSRPQRVGDRFEEVDGNLPGEVEFTQEWVVQHAIRGSFMQVTCENEIPDDEGGTFWTTTTITYHFDPAGEGTYFWRNTRVDYPDERDLPTSKAFLAAHGAYLGRQDIPVLSLSRLVEQLPRQ